MSARVVTRKGRGLATCLALVGLSLALLPLSLARAAWQTLIGRRQTTAKTGKTALVTGGRAQKAVYVTRALAKQGYRIVLAEERGWGELCATRFSRSVNSFYVLPSGGGKKYVEALLRIAAKERIDLFVPCSGVATALEEAEAAQLMREGTENGKKGSIQTLIQDVRLLGTLHEKDTFMNLVRDLDLDAPAGAIIKTPEDGLSFLRRESPNGKARFLFKAATVPDDVGRADMTTYPLLTAKGAADWGATEKRLRFGLHIPLANATPYLAQEYIAGTGASEWCTHATVIDGEVKAFVCCPSNDMLMTYHNATHTSIGHRARKWTDTFLSRLAAHSDWQASRLTGQFSFDFIYLPQVDRLVVIECNPRVHTAVCLLQSKSELFGAALDGSLKRGTTVTSDLTVDPISWLGYDITTRYIRRRESQVAYDLEEVGSDGAWQADDPLVYLFFYHVQWPALLLRQAFIRRKSFSRINVSTARIFEC